MPTTTTVNSVTPWRGIFKGKVTMNRVFLLVIGMVIMSVMLYMSPYNVQYFVMQHSKLKTALGIGTSGLVASPNATSTTTRHTTTGRTSTTSSTSTTTTTTTTTTTPKPTTTTTTTTTTTPKPTTTSTTTTTTTTTTPKPPTTTDKPVVTCSFPSLDPWDPEIRKYVKRYPPLNCTGHGKPSLVYMDDDAKTLRVNKTKVKKTVGAIDYCEYSPLLLGKNDLNLLSMNWSRKFEDSIELPPRIEHMLIQCKHKNNIVGETYKSRVIRKPEVEERSEKRYKAHLEENRPAETMSVLMVGVDGMSKQNLIRGMPKTRNFLLEKMNAKEFNKFNKVGDNTYQNIVVLHSGQAHTDIHKFNDFNIKKDYFDKIEEIFLWHEYQKWGYRTAMIFDSTTGTAYHYLKHGWEKPTFDYYPRPIPLKMNAHSKDGTDDICVGDTSEVTTLLDNWIQLTTMFNDTKTKPYFAYNFLTYLTHDNQNYAFKGDEMYLEFFQEIHRRNVLNNTILLFFSDHGARFGSMMYTFNGKIEGRSPYMFFVFPPWFEKKYPEEMNNFYINQNRLTTFYDIHATLLDIINFKGKKSKKSKDAKGISLFEKIPADRTCTDAFIPTEYCLCSQITKKNIPKDLTADLSNQLLAMINEKTKDKREICALLNLTATESIMKIKNEKTTKTSTYYQLSIKATPGGGTFEALLNYNVKTHKAVLVGEIVRLNLYRGQDGCVDSLDYKPYCFCLK